MSSLDRVSVAGEAGENTLAEGFARSSDQWVELIDAADGLAEIEAFRRAHWGAATPPWPSAEGDSDPLDREGFHFVLRDPNGIQGAVRVHLAAPPWVRSQLQLDTVVAADEPVGLISHLLISPSAAPGSLTYLASAAHLFAAATWVKLFVGCAPLPVVPLCLHYGARKLGPAFIDAIAGVQQPLFLLIGDQDHLARCRSPLAMADDDA